MKGEKFVIQGLGGRRVLEGDVEVRGAKNAVLKALAASVLFNDTVRFQNVPRIEDVLRAGDILRALGADVTLEDGVPRAVTISKTFQTELPRDIAAKLRASIVFTGPILARFGKVSFPHPGGCVIGERPIDLFLSGFEKMGARIKNREKSYDITADGGVLKGAEIFFRNQSVTATETLMMAAVLAHGKTVLLNAAREPEVESLARFLNSCGANIEGAGTSAIVIKGTKPLSAGTRTYTTPPDRIEAGSFLILGALAAKKLTIRNCDPSHVMSLIETLRATGVSIQTARDSIIVEGRGTPQSLRSVHVKTAEYPGFPTDIQAPMTIFLTQTSGRAMVFETIFEGRLGYVEDIIRMGARIDVCDPHRVIIHGPTPLRGRELQGPDLRAGLAFVIAGIIAKGESVVHNVYNIDRGYERIEERLRGIGVDIQRIQ